MMYKLYEEMYHHALTKFPEEACGFIKHDGIQYSFVPVDNIHDTPTQKFRINTSDILKHLDNSVAFFHSHVNQKVSKFSDEDKATSDEFNIPFLTIDIPSGNIYNYFPNGWNKQWRRHDYCYGLYDCVQTIYDYYKYELNIDFDYTIIRPQPESWMQDSYVSPFAKACSELGFKQVNDLQVNDIVLMQVRAKCQNHIGIYIGDNKILHTKAGKTSVIDLYNEAWQKRTTGIMRYAKS